MRVVHVTPTFLGSESLCAGAERYSTELAKAMATLTPTRLVSFGDRTLRERWGKLEVHIYKPLGYARGLRFNPLSLGFLASLKDADVIHCHQPAVLVTDLTLLANTLLGKRIFVTDLGGSSNLSLWSRFHLFRRVHRFLLISEYNAQRYRTLSVPIRIIGIGVNVSCFAPKEEKHPFSLKILHVGRILKHKGIHDLIEALPEGLELDVVGSMSDSVYYDELKRQAEGKAVYFYTDLDDDDLVQKYNEALATVLPATSDSGLTTVLESWACGTPVVVSRVGSLPELVEDGVTGFVIPPNDPVILKEKLEFLIAHRKQVKEMGRRAREAALKRYTWEAVAERCLKAYGDTTGDTDL